MRSGVPMRGPKWALHRYVYIHAGPRMQAPCACASAAPGLYIGAAVAAVTGGGGGLRVYAWR
jgi:hypothetical protein